MNRTVEWNGSPLSLPHESSATLGAILQALEPALGERGHVVTAVRLDGVDEPAFGSSLVSDRLLSEGARVEIESGSPASLVIQCLDEALGALPSVQAGIADVSAAFRIGAISDGNRLLAEVAESLGNLVSLAATVSTAVGTTLDAVEVEGTNGVALVVRLHEYADALGLAQKAGDWVKVADVLEFDVAPTVGIMAGLLEALRHAAVQADDLVRRKSA